MLFRSFIPQGGGDPQLSHRCPGEWLAIETMKVTAAFLARSISWTAPPQDLSVDLSRIPAQPASGFIMSDIRRISDERKPEPDAGAAKAA